MDIVVKKATSCMPLAREQEFSDILSKGMYGTVSNIWHFPGHIIVTTNENRKLFTFDCIPISLQQAFDQKSLDISNLTAPVLNCLSLADDIIALVDIYGHVQLWKFMDNCLWKSWGSLDLCHSNQAEVVSVAFVSSTHQLVWCEKRQLTQTSPQSSSPPSSSSVPQYCVCKKQLPATYKLAKVSNLAPPSVLMHNNPCCIVHPLSKDSLILSFMFDKEKVSVFIVLDMTNDILKFYVGEDSITSTIKDVDFQEIALKCLPSLVKAKPGRGDCGIRTDETKGVAGVLSSSGDLEIFTSPSPSSKRIECDRRCVQLVKFDLDPDTSSKALWFLHGKLMGILIDKTLNIYSTADGSKMCVTELDAAAQAKYILPSKSPAILAWIHADDQLYSLQARDSSVKELLTTPDKLPDDDLRQTDILRLARLQQRKCEGYSMAQTEEFEKLRARWQDDTGGIQQHSEVLQMLGPYMEEYWRLDSLTKALIKSDAQQVIQSNQIDSHASVVATAMEARTIGRSSRHAKLLWLSQIYPRELLDYLCRGISYQNDFVDQNELREWQVLIGLDGSDLLHFEFVCRLLFQLEPENLLKFVKCAEAVSEQAVGVSAFVRKKHSLIYYKAASECLPDCTLSEDPKMAASVKAKLILSSECEGCYEQALKCLLHYELWDQALSILKDLNTKENQSLAGSGRIVGAGTRPSRHHREIENKLPTLLHVTVKALAESQVLSQYVPDLFSLMPNWKSFLSFSKVATARAEIRQQQLTTSAQGIFASAEVQDSVPLESVRSYLLDLASEINIKKS